MLRDIIIRRPELLGRPQKNNLFARVRTEARYGFVSGCIGGNNHLILDIACGEGWGLDRLIEKSSRLIGIDYSSDALKHAKNNFKLKEDIFFMPMHACHVGFKNRTFDIVCALEILEHLREPKDMLREIHRILKDKGILILSTSNKAYWDKLSNRNPFHIKEYNFEELKLILEDSFEIESFQGVFSKYKRFEEHPFLLKICRKTKKFLRLEKWRLNERIKGKLFGGLSVGDYYLSDENLESCPNFFVICKKNN